MRSVENDTRGIIAPAEMARRVRLSRFAAPGELAGLIDWFWCVQWELPAGAVHRQRVLPQPGVNISVGDPPPEGEDPPPGPWPMRAVVNGVATGMTTRALAGAGVNLAAKTTTGGFGAWVDDVGALTDRVCDAGTILPPVAARLPELGAWLRASEGDGRARDAGQVEEAVALLADALISGLADRPEDRVATARQVAEIAAAAEHDRGVRRLTDLAELAGVAPRTLQRLFASHAGVSPTWVVRRFRLLEAAELVRDGAAVDWAAVAADLGYADQAHLVRDFTANIGLSPAAYARAQRPAPGARHDSEQEEPHDRQTREHDGVGDEQREHDRAVIRRRRGVGEPDGEFDARG